MRTILLSLMVLIFGIAQVLCTCAPDSDSNIQIAQSVDHHPGTSADHNSDDDQHCNGCQHCDSADMYAISQTDKVEATPHLEAKVAIVKARTPTPRPVQLRRPPAPLIDLRWRTHAGSPISRHDISLT